MGLFNITEIVDMGIEKEKKRRDFYDLVSRTFADKEIKDFFTKLKDWEETHIKKFGEIKSSLNQDAATDSYPGELQDYITTIVDDKLYEEVSVVGFSKNVKSPLDAIRYGIGFEKDAIIFFSEFLPYISSRENKDAIEKLIDEEKQHVVYLVGLRKKIQK